VPITNFRGEVQLQTVLQSHFSRRAGNCRAQLFAELACGAGGGLKRQRAWLNQLTFAQPNNVPYAYAAPNQPVLARVRYPFMW
jgi:hypothetical protein